MRRFLLSLAACFAATLSVMADDVTVTFDFTSADEVTAFGLAIPENGAGTNIEAALVKEGVTITNANAEGVNATRIFASKAADALGVLDLRIYTGSSLTVSCPADQIIKSIVWTTANKAEFSVEVGTVSNTAWVGEAASVVLTSTATSRLNTFAVTYGTAEEPVVDDATKFATINFTIDPTEWGVEVPEAGAGTDIGGKEFSDADATIVFTKGEGASNPCRYFLAKNGTYSARMYAPSTLSISVPTAYTIEEITFTSGNAANLASADNVWSAGSIDATLVWTPAEGEKVSSVTLTAGVTLQFNTITVKYAAAEEEGGEDSSAISRIEAATAASAAFNLAGQRVARPAAGVIVKDGRKQIVR